MSSSDLDPVIERLERENREEKEKISKVRDLEQERLVLAAEKESILMNIARASKKADNKSVSKKADNKSASKLQATVVRNPSSMVSMASILDPAVYVDATDNMTIACDHPLLVGNPALKAYGYLSSQGLYSWMNEDPKFNLGSGLILEIMAWLHSPKDQIVWLNQNGEAGMDHDAILQKSAMIDYKSHFVRPNTNKKMKHPSGASLTERDAKAIIDIWQQYDLVQENDIIRAVRIGWLTSKAALDAIEHGRTTYTRDKAFLCPDAVEKQANSDGKPYKPENQRYKITRDGMLHKDELVSYLRDKVGFNQNQPKTVLEWLLVHGRLSVHRGDYRLQLDSSNTHHLKNDRALSFRDPFGPSGYIKRSCSEKGGAKNRFQLPDYIKHLNLGHFNIDAKSVIEAFEKAGTLNIVP